MHLRTAISMYSESGSKLQGGKISSFFFFPNLSPHIAGNTKVTHHILHHKNRKANKENPKTLRTPFFSGWYFLLGGCWSVGLFVCLGKNLDVNHSLLRTCCLVLADSNHPTLLFFGRCYYNRHYCSEFGKHSKLREMLLHLLALSCSLDLQSHDVSLLFFFSLFFFPFSYYYYKHKLR